MNSAKNEYVNEMKQKFGYEATWHPGVPLALGDVGIYTSNVFERLSNLKDLGLNFEGRQDDSKTSLEHTSKGSVEIYNKLSGSVSPAETTLGNADGGIIVNFTKESSVLFKANNTTSPSIENVVELGRQIIDLFRQGKWDKHWVVITEIVIAESASVIISNTNDAKIELKANANINSNKFDIGNSDFDFSIHASRGLETNIISQEKMTPLFKVMKLKTKGFFPNLFNLITPHSFQNQHLDKLIFE